MQTRPYLPAGVKSKRCGITWITWVKKIAAKGERWRAKRVLEIDWREGGCVRVGWLNEWADEGGGGGGGGPVRAKRRVFHQHPDTA